MNLPRLQMQIDVISSKVREQMQRKGIENAWLLETESQTSENFSWDWKWVKMYRQCFALNVFDRHITGNILKNQMFGKILV